MLRAHTHTRTVAARVCVGAEDEMKTSGRLRGAFRDSRWMGPEDRAAETEVIRQRFISILIIPPLIRSFVATRGEKREFGLDGSLVQVSH